MLEILLISLGISFTVNVLFFIFAAWRKSDKVTDLSYGLSFIVVAAGGYLLNPNGTWPQALLTILIALWALRLAGYLFVRVIKMKRDKRFDGIRENFRKFAMFWLLQAFSVWLIMLPSTVYLSKHLDDSNVLIIVGSVIWLIGLTIETLADLQKYRFKSDKKNAGKWVDIGLWKYSRHPNYFGEIMVWLGIFVFTLSALENWELLAVVGLIYIIVLLLFGTGIPTIEKRYDQRFKDDPEYQEYKRRTSKLVPWFRLG